MYSRTPSKTTSFRVAASSLYSCTASSLRLESGDFEKSSQSMGSEERPSFRVVGSSLYGYTALCLSLASGDFGMDSLEALR